MMNKVTKRACIIAEMATMARKTCIVEVSKDGAQASDWLDKITQKEEMV